MKKFFLFIFVVGHLVTFYPEGDMAASEPLFAESQTFRQFESICSKIQLIPISSDNSDGRQAGQEQRIYNYWQQYDDPYVSFFYPAHPNTSIDVSGDDEIPPERFFSRTYQIRFPDDVSYRLELSNISIFEPGIDQCGFLQSAYDKYLFHNAAIYRISFLENGDIGKIQLLCKDLRMLMFPPVQIDQKLSLKIALGIQLKDTPYNSQEMQQYITERYGFEGRLGLLEKGMPRKGIIALLGPPTYATSEVLTYIVQERRRDFTSGELMRELMAQLHLEQGILREFSPGWLTSRMLPPQRGSLYWIREKIFGRPPIIHKKKDYDLGPLTETDIPYIFDRFTELALQVSGRDWNRLCSAIFELHNRGYNDPRILPLVRNRFLEPNIDFGYALWILRELEPDHSQELFIKKVYQLMEQAKIAVKDRKESEEEMFIGNDNLYNLLSFIESPEREALILIGMDHPHKEVRAEAYRFWYRLPVASGLPKLEKGLTDPLVAVRRESARAFARRYGTTKHLPLLRQQLRQEPSENVRRLLQQAIQRLTGKSQEEPKKRY